MNSLSSWTVNFEVLMMRSAIAPKILTQEILEQRALMPPSRFRPRNESAAAGADSRLRVREIVSEYSFGALSEGGARNLLEFRNCRSEEHTSELQSLRHLVCRLLL